MSSEFLFFGDDFIKFLNENAVKKITSAKNFQEVVSSATEKISDKTEQHIKKTAENVKNKISETVSNVAAEISAMEEERRIKNLETMNQIRFNSNHLSDAQLRTLISDRSIDKFKRIGYAVAFADRYSDRRD